MDSRNCPFVEGDHIYRCINGSVPLIGLKHHAIVVDSYRLVGNRGNRWLLLIAHFNADPEGFRGPCGSSNSLPSSFGSSGSIFASTSKTSVTQTGVFYEELCLSDDWHKFEYDDSFWEQVTSTGAFGVSISSERTSLPVDVCDPVDLVIQRANFLLDHPEELPDYQLLNSNCECVAVWCKTGLWVSLQAAEYLSSTSRLGMLNVVLSLAGPEAMIPIVGAMAGINALQILNTVQNWRKHTTALNEAFALHQMNLLNEVTLEKSDIDNLD